MLNRRLGQNESNFNSNKLLKNHIGWDQDKVLK
jgi:hypothetical protein